MIGKILGMLLGLSFSIIALGNSSDEIKELSDAFFAQQLKYSIGEKYKLLRKIRDAESRAVVGCSILKETNELIAYIELDVPKLIKNKETLALLKKMASKEKESIGNNEFLNNISCNNT